MEPNVDRGMWAIVALLIAVVIGGAVMLIFPNFVGQIGNEMSDLMTSPSKLINKGDTNEKVYMATDDDFSGESNGTFKYIGEELELEIPHSIKGVSLTSYHKMFEGTNVSKVVSTNKKIINMDYMFSESTGDSLDLSRLYTGNVKSMSFMFNYNKVKEIDVSKFNTSRLKNARYMFYHTQSKTIDVSNFDTSNITDMSFMFHWTRAHEIDVSNFDTRKATSMSHMFSVSSIKNIDLSSFDTSNVVSFRAMFSSFKGNGDIDVSSFDTSKAQTVERMFFNVKQEVLDLRGFDLSSVPLNEEPDKAEFTNKMFQGSVINTIFARSEYDANRITNSSYFPDGTDVVVK